MVVLFVSRRVRVVRSREGLFFFLDGLRARNSVSKGGFCVILPVARDELCSSSCLLTSETQFLKLKKLEKDFLKKRGTRSIHFPATPRSKICLECGAKSALRRPRRLWLVQQTRCYRLGVIHVCKSFLSIFSVLCQLPGTSTLGTMSSTGRISSIASFMTTNYYLSTFMSYTLLRTNLHNWRIMSEWIVESSPRQTSRANSLGCRTTVHHSVLFSRLTLRQAGSMSCGLLTLLTPHNSSPKPPFVSSPHCLSS